MSCNNASTRLPSELGKFVDWNQGSTRVLYRNGYGNVENPRGEGLFHSAGPAGWNVADVSQIHHYPLLRLVRADASLVDGAEVAVLVAANGAQKHRRHSMAKTILIPMRF